MNSDNRAAIVDPMEALCYNFCVADSLKLGQVAGLEQQPVAHAPGCGRGRLTGPLGGDAIAEPSETPQDQAPRVRVTVAERIFDRAYGMATSGADVTLWHKVDSAAARI